MRVADFDYTLPEELIAQTPLEPRDASRLLVLQRDNGKIEHRHFREIGAYLRPGDLLVANESKVLPARLYGQKLDSGGGVEVLLLRKLDEVRWEALVRPGRSLRPGVRLIFSGAREWQQGPDKARRVWPTQDGVHAFAEVAARASDETGARIIRFDQPIEPLLDELGVMPLPPYIHTPLDEPDRYQTVYAHTPGSAAAPTAGLHFTPRLLEELRGQGIGFATVTLHVGLDTFRPVSEERLESHKMHAEWYELPSATAEAINATHAAGGRIVAVGTTSVRVLESYALAQQGVPVAEAGIDYAAIPNLQSYDRGVNPAPTDMTQSQSTANLQSQEGWTRLFIYPGYQFRLTEAMITNFHLPRSTLLALVSAFAGRERIMDAYDQAIREGYRFYSFGDAMLIV